MADGCGTGQDHTFLNKILQSNPPPGPNTAALGTGEITAVLKNGIYILTKKKNIQDMKISGGTYWGRRGAAVNEGEVFGTTTVSISQRLHNQSIRYSTQLTFYRSQYTIMTLKNLTS